MKQKMIGLSLAALLLLSGCAAAPAVSTSAAGANTAEAVQPAASSASSVQAASESTGAASPAEAGDTAFFAQVKDYLLNGQTDVPEAGQLHWSEAFLNAADMDAAYQAYLGAGGAAEDTAAFAVYLTENATAPENWRELFEQDLAETYEQTPVEYEDLGDGVYQVMIDNDGELVPFVTVDSRTGWYHG